MSLWALSEISPKRITGLLCLTMPTRRMPQEKRNTHWENAEAFIPKST